ncbi:MAG TPA: DUF6221 family protein [Mycobacterium sp.]|nr:DUF6221 family protein [Mycobacterium sp.]
MTDVDELIAFIWARLDEDEQVAGSNSPELWPGETLRKLADYEVRRYALQPHDFSPQRRAHVLRFHPTRVLRGVEAKRRILERYEDCLVRMEDDEYDGGEAALQAREYEDFALPNIADEWRDHPDWRKEWGVAAT